MLAACAPDAPPPAAAAPADPLARAVGGTARDPLVGEVLSLPLMTDVDLREAANTDAVRPPSRPLAMPLPSPLALDALPESPAPPATAGFEPALGACPGSTTITATWALAVPLPAAARVIAAEGTRGAECTRITVRFAAAMPQAALAGWYRRRGALRADAAAVQGRDFALVTHARLDGGTDAVLTVLRR